jgi:hypothetical protein
MARLGELALGARARIFWLSLFQAAAEGRRQDSTQLLPKCRGQLNAGIYPTRGDFRGPRVRYTQFRHHWTRTAQDLFFTGMVVAVDASYF